MATRRKKGGYYVFYIARNGSSYLSKLSTTSDLLHHSVIRAWRKTHPGARIHDVFYATGGVKVGLVSAATRRKRTSRR